MSQAPHPLSEAIDPSDRTVYRHLHRDKLRYGDIDRQDHVNNVAFATFLEEGRIIFLNREVTPFLGPEDLFALVTITIDYKHEILYPGEVEVGTALTGLGRSSMHFVQGIFNLDRCVAQATSTVVLMSAVTRKSSPLPDPVRRHLEPLAGPRPADIAPV